MTSWAKAELPEPEPDPAPPPGLLARLLAVAWIPRLAIALVFLLLPLGLDDMFQYDMLGLSLARGNGYRWYQRDYVDRIRSYIERSYLVDLEAEPVPDQGYPTAFRAPGYPAFLALVYAVVGEAHRLESVRLIQAALGAALAPLTLILAHQLGFRRRTGVAAALLVGLYPILWVYPVGLGSENTFILLTLAGVIVLIRARDRGQDRLAAAAGLLLGAACLTRSVLALFVGLAAVWLARQAGLRRAAFFAAAAAALLLPWAVRNSLLLGRPAFVENSMGYNLFVGYHPEGNGGFVADVAVLPTRFLEDGERDAWSFDQAVSFMRDDPQRALALLPRRLAYLVGFEWRELVFFYSNGFFGPIAAPALLLVALVLTLPWAALALLSGFGLATAEHRPGRNLSLLLIAATLAAYVPILAEPRFHLPLVPVLAPYAAAVVLEPRRLRPAAGRGGVILACAAAAVVLLLWVWDPVGTWSTLARVLAPGGHTLRLSY